MVHTGADLGTYCGCRHYLNGGWLVCRRRYELCPFCDELYPLQEDSKSRKICANFSNKPRVSPWNHHKYMDIEMNLKPLFSSISPHWRTPEWLYRDLDAEFSFTLDPCPNHGEDGLSRSWAGERVYCNPPYGRGVGRWLEKSSEAELAVYLLPSRTDTRWWHEYAMKADEIRFIRGRLRFNDCAVGAPFPSVVLVYRKKSVLP